MNTSAPIRCAKCDCILIERVHLDDKGNTAADASGRHEEIQYDSQKDEHFVNYAKCKHVQTVHLRVPL